MSVPDRRSFAVLLGAFLLAGSRAVSAQPKAGRVFRIGYLGDAALPDGVWDAFRRALRQHGYVEGKNLSIELRFAGGRSERLPSLAAELARLNLDLMVTQSSQAARAAKEATPTTPVVMAGVADPVGRGLVTSLAHPGVGAFSGRYSAELRATTLDLATNVPH